MYPQTQPNFVCELAPELKRMCLRSQRFLLGNSLFIPLTTCWIWYILSNLQSRDVSTPLLPQPCLLKEDESDSESDSVSDSLSATTLQWEKEDNILSESLSNSH